MPIPHGNRLLVFDLDDTLYPEHQFVLSGYHAAGDWLQRQQGISGFAELAVQRFQSGQRLNIFDDILTELGLPDLSPQLVEVYRFHHPTLTLFEDAAWALEHYQPLALVTDGFAQAQRNKVAALGIASRFQTLVFSDDFGRENWKPSIVPFEAVMQATGATGAACTYVADNPRKDFIGPRALGWRTIRIRRPDGVYASLEPEPGAEPHAEIHTLRDLPRVLVS